MLQTVLIINDCRAGLVYINNKQTSLGTLPVNPGFSNPVIGTTHFALPDTLTLVMYPLDRVKSTWKCVTKQHEKVVK